MKKLAFSDVGSANKEVVEETLQVGNSGRGEIYGSFQINGLVNKMPSTTVAITEMQQYLNIPNIDRKNDPLKWQKENALVYPSIEKLVKKHLIIPGIFSACSVKQGNLYLPEETHLNLNM